jgi:adenylate cyclase
MGDATTATTIGSSQGAAREESSLKRLASSFVGTGFESDEDRLQATVLVISTMLIAPAAVLWGAIYLAFDEPVAASIPLGYSALSAVSIVVFRVTSRYQLFRLTQLVLIIVAPFLVMVAAGGFVNSGAVIFWALLGPLEALLLTSRREAVGWTLAFFALVVVSALIEPNARASNNLPKGVVIAFFAMNVLGPSTVAVVLLYYFVGQKNGALESLEREQEKSERLLLNVLPKEIAPTLKEGNEVIAEHFDAVSVLFADIVGFTPLSEKLPPTEMVGLLNDIFSYFDTLTDKYGLEKIRTIGDNYMVASGVPVRRDDHAHALANMALEMNSFLDGRDQDGHEIEFRIGMNSGPAVAGVVGTTKFHYDIWGDAVNTASRMESHGVPGRIHVTSHMRELLQDDFTFMPRGEIEVKGKGTMSTWFLEWVRYQNRQKPA